MRQLIVCLLLVAASVAWASPKETVLQQISAMQNDQWQQAWRLASSGIQRQFRSPERFQRLVEGQYAAIVQALDISVKVDRENDDTAIVVVELVSPSYEITEAFYILATEQAQWRVFSVQLRPGPPTI